MKIIDLLKRYKPVHWLYNIFNAKQLKHNSIAYQQFDLDKPLFSSISSKDFPDKTSRAWLDLENSNKLVENTIGFKNFPADIQIELKNWSDNGFLIWKQFFNEKEIDDINKEVEAIEASGNVKVTHDNKLPFLNKQSLLIKNISENKTLLELLGFILGKEVIPFQTLNFIKGSGQRAHSDSIHMTTYPLGYLIAVWVALEDIDPESGPLFYYPGSHQLPYLLNNDFGNISNAWMLGKKKYSDYEDVIEDLINKKMMQPKVFLPKKGDILVWHANLLHGGLPIKNSARTRKSMVIHYYAKDVIKYHEITERPSLL